MKILRLLIITITVLFIGSTLVLGQVEKEGDNSDSQWIDPAKINSKSKARMNFDHTTYDFGSIAKGSRVTHNFWFENTGSDTLIITRIKHTCGCTSTRLKGIVVPPGDRSSIDIVFDSGKFNGRVTKSIKIECNDPVNPYLDLRFKAVINNPLQILEYSPLQADFQNVRAGTQSKATISLTNVDTTESKLIIVEKPSASFIKTQLKDDTIKPEATTEIEFILTDNLEPGQFLTSISIEAEKKPGSRITIPIIGTIDK